jgi:hypothetical protein
MGYSPVVAAAQTLPIQYSNTHACSREKKKKKGIKGETRAPRKLPRQRRKGGAYLETVGDGHRRAATAGGGGAGDGRRYAGAGGGGQQD